VFELMKRRAYVCCLSLFNIYLYFTINMVAQIINNTLLNELILLTHTHTHTQN